MDLADAMSFYKGLLAWEYSQMEDSPLADYAMISAHGKLIGGLRKVNKPVPRTDQAPLLYFTVEMLAPAVARAKELGAEIVGKTVELGRDRGRYQWIRDRQGNLVGLWGPQ